MRIPSKVVVIGDCLEVEFSDGATYKPRGSLLCSSPGAHTLWILPRGREPWSNVRGGKNEAHKLYETWSNFEPDREKKLRIDDRGKLRRYKRVKSIVYSSDKWNENRKKIDYIHTFNRNHYPTLSTDNIKNPGFCRISGGKLAVKAVGITG